SNDSNQYYTGCRIEPDYWILWSVFTGPCWFYGYWSLYSRNHHEIFPNLYRFVSWYFGGCYLDQYSGIDCWDPNFTTKRRLFGDCYVRGSRNHSNCYRKYAICH